MKNIILCILLMSASTLAQQTENSENSENKPELESFSTETAEMPTAEPSNSILEREILPIDLSDPDLIADLSLRIAEIKEGVSIEELESILEAIENEQIDDQRTVAYEKKLQDTKRELTAKIDSLYSSALGARQDLRDLVAQAEKRTPHFAGVNVLAGVIVNIASGDASLRFRKLKGIGPSMKVDIGIMFTMYRSELTGKTHWGSVPVALSGLGIQAGSTNGKNVDLDVHGFMAVKGTAKKDLLLPVNGLRLVLVPTKATQKIEDLGIDYITAMGTLNSGDRLSSSIQGQVSVGLSKDVPIIIGGQKTWSQASDNDYIHAYSQHLVFLWKQPGDQSYWNLLTPKWSSDAYNWASELVQKIRK